MINNVVLMGRICQYPELKTTNTGITVTSFSLAVDRSYVRAGEERQADFINIVAWRGTAEFIAKYFQKGSMIAIQGSIQTRSYEDGQGNKRYAFEVVASNVSFCGSKAENGQATTQKDTNDSVESFSNNLVTGDFSTIDYDEELPF